MEMLLMIACMSLFGFAVTAVAFGIANRQEEAEPAVEPLVEQVPVLDRSDFFNEGVLKNPFRKPVPIEVLLMQIDSHVRLEQAAAESFLAYPNATLLHSATRSPLLH